MNKIINLKELPNQGQRERRSRARATREEPVAITRSTDKEISRTRAVDESISRPQELQELDTIRVREPQPEGRPVIQDPLTGGEIAEETITSIQNQAVDDYIQQVTNQNAIVNGGKTFQLFDISGDIIDASKETVTAGLWSDNLTELRNYFTQSMTAAQSQYYVNVNQKLPSLTGSATQYAIAYGNALGSGSSTNGSIDDAPSRAIYSQYRQLLLNKDVTRFSTPASGSTDSIYVINFQRNRAKEKLDPGNFEIPLSTLSSSQALDATGSVEISGAADTFTLIDDSTIASASNEDAGNVYFVVSGSIANGVYNPAAPHYYGRVFCDHSTIVLDGDVLDTKLNFLTNTASNSNGSNHYRLHHSISGSYVTASKGFKARNKETVSSTFYFVRVKNGDFNYSNNPSYVTGDQGDILQDEYIGDPKAYITTVGLYNDSRELLAIAKLSKPLLKSKKRELNVRVKLEY
jgi:hypothetical protein